jgi:threonine dehydrogenase-like Zn-dependent dehydrogenase
MHIVLMAWLYVTLMMALTMSSALAGAAFFIVIGMGPVALCAIMARRRQVARRERVRRNSTLEQLVHDADDGDTQQNR